MQIKELERKNNLITISFVISAILIELLGVFFIEGKFNIKNPLPMILILIAIVLLSTVFDSFGKKVILIGYLILSAVITIILSIVFTMQGGAVFKVSMFALINEGLEIAGSLIINYKLLFSLILVIVGFIILNFKKIDKKETSLQLKLSKILTILIIFIFLVIPLIISVAYGNVPFFDRSPLYSSDVLVTNNQKLFESTNMPIFIKTYTWQEIQGYIVRKEVTFVRVFRNIVVLFLTAVIAIVVDRRFGHLLPINIRRR